ncbi:MAG: 2Fe-2S iron-sulfur cluster-binding protein [Parachlamydiaceae bacterium]
MPQVLFNQHNRILQVKEGTDFLHLSYLDNTLPLKFGCRKGGCGSCAIRILSGEANLSRQTKEERATVHRLKIDPDKRLACQCAIKGDVVIDG